MLTALTLLSLLAQEPEADPFPGRHGEDFEKSHWIRQEQFDQIHGYLQSLVSESHEKRAAFFTPDFTSEAAYEKSLQPFREALCVQIGYPPPKPVEDAEPRYEMVVADEYATIYRMWLEVLEGVELYAVLSIPHGLEGPAPLLICQHGGGGSPEVIHPFTGNTGQGVFNYGWMVQRALREGYVTWAPGLLFRLAGTEEIEGPDRIPLDKQLRHVGTSILAVELWKIRRGLDEVLKRPEVDPERVGMMGLSYGGLYTQYAVALDPRIKVAVSSCYFNDRTRYSRDDWSFMDYLNRFTDPEICALICPRGLMIEVGIQDELFEVDGAREEAPKARAYWDKLGIADRFAFVEFDGGHEFDGATAFEFAARFLK